MTVTGPTPSPRVQPPERPRAPRRRPPSPLHVITAALGTFLVVLTLLALQVRAGKDPSLSAGAASGAGAKSTSAAAPRAAAKRVVTRTS